MPSPSEVANFRRLIAQLSGAAVTAVKTLWDTTQDWDALQQAYPELVDPYLTGSAEMTAEWYASLAPESDFTVETPALIPHEALQASTRWALTQPDPLPALSGSTERRVFTASRDTVHLNAEREHVRYARHAAATACPFCKLLATRGAVYHTKDTAVKGHDNCHCIAVPVREGDNYEPPEYVKDWQDQYLKARADAGSGDPKRILSSWQKIDRESDLIASVATPKIPASLAKASSREEIAAYMHDKHGVDCNKLLNSELEKGITRGDYEIKPRFVDLRNTREFAQAVDDMMTKYPFLQLDEMRAEFYPTGFPLQSSAHAGGHWNGKRFEGASHISINGLSDGVGDTNGTAWKMRRDQLLSEKYDSGYKAAAVERPVYATMIHEMGHVVDFNSDTLARGKALGALDDHFRTLPEGKALIEKFDNTAHLQPEYQAAKGAWLKENLVSEYSFNDSDRDKGINPIEALAEAFADVELRGEEATITSKIMHKAMIEAARTRREARLAGTYP